jgi:hypothetical protein
MLRAAFAVAISGLILCSVAHAQAPKSVKVQSTWPASITLQESQRDYAAKVVPAKRYMFPPYSFAANYYWPQQGGAVTAKKDARKP